MNATKCQWSANTFDRALVDKKSATPRNDVSNGEESRGMLAPHAASVLMKLRVCSTDRKVPSSKIYQHVGARRQQVDHA